mmetsp:Transcript_87866/g.138700  ORF Transcript_87866/g.138700 Transcript_87866/m.138700 type:complete len:112 (+) Transcript_87866:253-588(+)
MLNELLARARVAQCREIINQSSRILQDGRIRKWEEFALMKKVLLSISSCALIGRLESTTMSGTAIQSQSGLTRCQITQAGQKCTSGDSWHSEEENSECEGRLPIASSQLTR